MNSTGVRKEEISSSTFELEWASLSRRLPVSKRTHLPLLEGLEMRSNNLSVSRLRLVVWPEPYLFPISYYMDHHNII